MYYCCIYISILILLSMIRALYGHDFYLISSGRLYDVVDYDMYGRKWIRNSSMGTQFTGKAWFDPAINKDGLIDEVPYYTALLTNTLYSYHFPIKEPGRKYVRLYFYTNCFNDYDNVNANFSVMANDKVLTNFPKPRAHLDLLHPVCLVYEYSVPVLTDKLDLLLAPDYVHRDSYAFINGIEIVSHPDIYSGTATLVGKVKGRMFVIDKRATLETIARLNVGGERITILDDSGQLFRLWDTDEGFIGSDHPGIRVDASAWDTILTYPPPNFSEDFAPRLMYQTARIMRPGDNRYNKMTWRFPVDPKYYYFIRLHFCEVVSHYTANDRVFNIHINGYLTERGVDVVAWTGKPGVPVYKDYVVFIPKSQKPEVRIVLTPDLSSHTKYYDTLLNGIEVFKVSDHNGDLDVSFNPYGNFRVKTKKMR